MLSSCMNFLLDAVVEANGPGVRTVVVVNPAPGFEAGPGVVSQTTPATKPELQVRASS